jgi:transcriptional regulator with XRE-family HTH domain
MDIGQEIRKHRESQGLTQEALSKKSGIHRFQLSEWETGKKLPTLSSVLKVLAALNLKLTVERRKSNEGN